MGDVISWVTLTARETTAWLVGCAETGDAGDVLIAGDSRHQAVDRHHVVWRGAAYPVLGPRTGGTREYRYPLPVPVLCPPLLRSSIVAGPLR